ncbi:MAG: N-acetylglucosamine-6-phosphate deacetylase [Chloroflexi bacterium]|nr:N-acetylglucosamine-6-phosphate deacetylase [Chloroflexota bacterium]
MARASHKLAQARRLELPDAQRIDGAGGYLAPAFIDLHVHGGHGFDTMDATPEALRGMARFLAAHGVANFLATTVTASREAITAALRNIAECIGAQPDGATLLGAHLEGPYINVKARGAQPAEHVRLAAPAEYAEWLALTLNAIRQVIVAPEFEANVAFMAACAERGILISIGHTQASYEQALDAVRRGARQTTHTFNAMTGLHHRALGVVGAALTCDLLTCELIADNHHVHPAVMALLVRLKGAQGVIAVTDAIRAAGMSEGQSELGGQIVYVRSGKATLSDGTLAGSLLTMDAALRNLQAATGLGVEALMPIFSANAARQLGLAHRKGSLRVGYDADLVLLDSALRVQMTFAEGRPIYQRRT